MSGGRLFGSPIGLGVFGKASNMFHGSRRRRRCGCRQWRRFGKVDGMDHGLLPNEFGHTAGFGWFSCLLVLIACDPGFEDIPELLGGGCGFERLGFLVKGGHGMAHVGQGIADQGCGRCGNRQGPGHVRQGIKQGNMRQFIATGQE